MSKENKKASEVLLICILVAVIGLYCILIELLK